MVGHEEMGFAFGLNLGGEFRLGLANMCFNFALNCCENSRRKAG